MERNISSNVIYLCENGKVKINSRKAQEILLFIEKENPEPIAKFTSDHCEYGYFDNKMFIAEGGIVILGEWQPTQNYRREETVLVFIPLP